MLVRQSEFNIKYLLIVIILTAIFTGGILGYWYWWLPKQGITNWKTYRNETMKFEIKHPEDWKHQSDVLNEVFTKKFIKDSNEFVCRLDIAGTLTENFEDYMKDYYQGKTPIQTEININGIFAIKAGELPYHCHYWVKRENGEKFSFQITQIIEKIITNKEGQKVAYGYVDDPECLDIFNQIFSTFRFLE